MGKLSPEELAAVINQVYHLGDTFAKVTLALASKGTYGAAVDTPISSRGGIFISMSRLTWFTN